MTTKHTIACTHGANLGDVLEFELNEKPRKVVGVTLSIRDGKIYAQREQRAEAEVEKRHPAIETELGNYVLLKSDLDEYKPDYSGWREFKGTGRLCKGPVEKDVIERVRSSLNDFQKRAISQISGSLEEYVNSYAENPLEIIEKQNKLMSDLDEDILYRFVDHNGDDIDESENLDEKTIIAKRKKDVTCFEQLVWMNAEIERQILNKNYRKEHTEKNTEELHNIEYLAEGDYSPATETKLGQQTRKDKRGNLLIHKTSEKILDLLAEAKIAASNPKNNKLKTAMKVYSLLMEKYSDKRAYAGRDKYTKSLGGFMENGGVCIDKALTLQLALQEAGIKSRFVRGRSGGRHAWVEADVLDKGKYALMLDPHKFNGVVATKSDAMAKRLYKYEDCDGTKLDNFNTIWRSK